jgi:hypothetical protein
MIIPHIVVTYLLVDRVFWRIRHKLNNTYRQINNYYSIQFSILGTAISHALFAWGGFYERFEVPQIIMVTYAIYQLGINLIRNNKKREDSFDISITLFNFMFILLLLYMGRFYDKMIYFFNLTFP